MRVIYKAPGCAPEPRDIPNTLEELQAAVGGYIETVTFATDACVICNEEGRLKGLPHNCRFLGVDFVGPILIVGVAGEEFTDLSPEATGMLLRAWRQMMDYKKAIETLRPMADNYVLPGVVEALEMGIRAMQELPKAQAERDDAKRLIEQLMEDLRGDCTSCAKTDDFQNCMGNGHYFNACEDCEQDCRCKSCREGGEWEWRGVQEGQNG